MTRHGASERTLVRSLERGLQCLRDSRVLQSFPTRADLREDAVDLVLLASCADKRQATHQQESPQLLPLPR